MIRRMLTRKDIEVVCYVAVHWVFACTIPTVTVAAEHLTFYGEHPALKLRVRDKPLVEVYEMLEDDF